MTYYVNTNSNSNGLTVGNIVLNNGGGVWNSTNSATTYTVGVSTGTYSTNWNAPSYASVTINDDGIKMKEEADLMIGGKSIKKMLETIESRLAILEPNIKLESEWEDLKRLGDEYRALEKEIQEKMKTWDILKKDN